MRISVPKESKVQEYRVGLTPAAVVQLVQAGHEVMIETGAATAIGFADADYVHAGGRIVGTDAAFDGDMIIKVKEPSLEECARMRAGQILFTYLHLAAAPQQARALMANGVTAIAYETVEDREGRLPLLAPMSEVAGRMSVQVGAQALLATSGGRGTLLGGVPGVAPGKVVIIGAGMAGSNAAQIAVGMMADVTLMDNNIARLRQLSATYDGRARVLMASPQNIADAVREADLVVGAALIPGATAPRLIDRPLLRQMQPGSVLVDISIDQGGCFETSRPTTHEAPTFIEEGVVHYCVTNMPGAVARTSTQALNNVTVPYIMALAELGVEGAMATDAGLAKGLNVSEGQIRHPAVAEALAASAPRAA